MNPAISDIDMMNQNEALAGSVDPGTAAIQNFDTIVIPAMRMFIERNSGTKVIRSDFR